MSDPVVADIEIDAPPEKVWQVVMDPDRFGEWVTIHRKVNSADDGPPREGMKMEQTLCLRGALRHSSGRRCELQYDQSPAVGRLCDVFNPSRMRRLRRDL